MIRIHCVNFLYENYKKYIKINKNKQTCEEFNKKKSVLRLNMETSHFNHNRCRSANRL